MRPLAGRPSEEARPRRTRWRRGGWPKVPASPASRRRSRRRVGAAGGGRHVVVHDRAAPRARARGHRARRRRDRPVPLVHRHRERRAICRCEPGVRRRRPATQGLTPATVEAALTPTTKAVILVHQGGTPADIDADSRSCATRAASRSSRTPRARVGATYRGAPIGAHSELVAFSFHPRKVITTGEGGMLVTDDARLGGAGPPAPRARHEPRARPSVTRPAVPLIEQYLEIGFNYRMTDIQAAVGIVQLESSTRSSDAVASSARATRPCSPSPGLAAMMIGDPADGTTNFQSFWVLPSRGRSRSAATTCSPPGRTAGISRSPGDHGRAPRAGVRRRGRRAACRSPSGSPATRSSCRSSTR